MLKVTIKYSIHINIYVEFATLQVGVIIRYWQ